MYMQQIEEQPPQYSLQGPAPNQGYPPPALACNQIYPGPIQVQNQFLPINQQKQQVQPQIIYVQAPQTQQPQTKAERIHSTYKWRNSHIAGICHVVIGIICVGFGGGAIGLQSTAYFRGHGIWCGIIFIITGGFALLASSNRGICAIATHMAFAFLSIVLAIAGAGIGVVGAIVDVKDWEKPDLLKERVAMNAVVAGLSILEIGVCIWSVAICNVLCSGGGGKCGCYGCDECYKDEEATTQVQYAKSPPQQLQVAPTAAGAAAAVPMDLQSVPAAIPINPHSFPAKVTVEDSEETESNEKNLPPDYDSIQM